MKEEKLKSILELIEEEVALERILIGLKEMQKQPEIYHGVAYLSDDGSCLIEPIGSEIESIENLLEKNKEKRKRIKNGW